jgi:hypothetical protein
VGVVYYLNPETGAWLRYVPAKPEVSNLTTMEFGQSYLLLLTAPTAMTVPTEQAFLATPTSCPDCGQWQSAAQQCLADYDQCVTEFGDCVDSLTACLALESQSPDLTEVCQLINDLRWDNQTLQGAWGFLLVTLMFSDDISVSDWGPTDLAIGDVNWTVSQLQSWTILNCH